MIDGIQTNGGSERLSGTRVAVLATDGFEASELYRPLAALREAGAEVSIISISKSSEQIRGWADGDWGESLDVDGTIDDRTSDDFDALVLPGGVMNPDKLRMDDGAVAFVRNFFEEGKPVAAICHAPWLLVEADVARGRRLTSYPSVRTDLENAGAEWVDEEVVVDGGLVTSRNPGDLDAFIAKMLEEIQEGIHAPHDPGLR
jgi:protease I